MHVPAAPTVIACCHTPHGCLLLNSGMHAHTPPPVCALQVISVDAMDAAADWPTRIEELRFDPQDVSDPTWHRCAQPKAHTRRPVALCCQHKGTYGMLAGPVHDVFCVELCRNRNPAVLHRAVAGSGHVCLHRRRLVPALLVNLPPLRMLLPCLVPWCAPSQPNQHTHGPA